MQTAETRNQVVPQTTGLLADHGIDPAIYARRWKTLGALCLALLIIIMGNTTLNVALCPSWRAATPAR